MAHSLQRYLQTAANNFVWCLTREHLIGAIMQHLHAKLWTIIKWKIFRLCFNRNISHMTPLAVFVVIISPFHICCRKIATLRCFIGFPTIRKWIVCLSFNSFLNINGSSILQVVINIKCINNVYKMSVSQWILLHISLTFTSDKTLKRCVAAPARVKLPPTQISGGNILDTARL